MTATTLILVALVIGMAVAIYFQMKASQHQADEQKQLLSDYQRRVDEQQKLLDDYRALEKNFDNVGEGYEQALLAFDKMQEEKEQMQQMNTSLENRCNDLQYKYDNMLQASEKAGETLRQVTTELQQMSKCNNDRKLAMLAGKVSDLEDVSGDKPIERIDNVLVSQIAGEAIRVSGIDKITYLTFDLQIAPDAAATMLSTNATKAARALTHLLDNALKFTTDGSVKLAVTVDMMKMQAYYTVEDTGAGIDVAEADHIFEPYVKLNQYFDGLGIGLTVARNIARRLGGDLVLDQSYAGPGARFVLTLPI